MLDNAAYYDEFAAGYEAHRHAGYHAMLDDLEVDLIAPYVRDADVLEVGCGTGLLLRRVAPMARTARGLDLSEGMLARARARGLDVRQGDACALPYEDASFDVVYSFKVLAHVREIDRALMEVRRVLRPGGVAALEFYNPWSLRYLAKRAAGAQPIAENVREDAVYTRWDSPIDVARRVEPLLRIERWAGVRVVTPAAALHRAPLLSGALRRAELAARDGALARLGGFLVVIARRPESDEAPDAP